jgi:hypothetical protein
MPLVGHGNARPQTYDASTNNNVPNKVIALTEKQTTKGSETLLTWPFFFRLLAQSNELGFPALTPEQ